MKYLLAAMVSTIFGAQAATIAIIDSGVDTEHVDLVHKLWINPVEKAGNGRDEDRNGYQDDVFGWNFAENNNLVIDRKYVGTFSEDPYKFFDIQGRQFLGNVTPEDEAWLLEKRQDAKFIKEMGIFGNFVHGTHVAGIAADNNDRAKILSVKLIPTEVNPFVKKEKSNPQMPNMEGLPKSIRMQLLKASLNKLAETQMLQLEEIANYVGEHKSDVANGSFGTGFPQAMRIVPNIFKIFFLRAPTKEETVEVTKYFINTLVKHGKKMVEAAPKTLFVFEA